MVFSPGIGKRRKLGAATRSGLGIARGGQKFPGRREWQGAAGSSLALGAARDMPRRACLPRKRGKQGAAGRVAEASRGGGNTSSRIFQHMRPHMAWLTICLSHANDPRIPNRPSSRETPDEERRRTVLFGNGKAHPLNGDARRIRVGLPGLRWARSVCNPGWTPLASRCDKQSFPLRAATTGSRPEPESVRCTPGAWRSSVEVAAPFPPRADSKGVSV